MASKTTLGEYRRLATALRTFLDERKNNLIITVDGQGIELRHNTKRPNHESSCTFFYTEEVVDFCRVFRLSHYITCGFVNDAITAQMRIYGRFNFDKKD